MKEPNALDQVKPALLNSTLSDIGVYVSKAISQAARDNPDIMNMSIGEPAFGPPAHLLAEIAQTDLTQEAFLSSAKRYGHSLGSWRCVRRSLTGICAVITSRLILKPRF